MLGRTQPFITRVTSRAGAGGLAIAAISTLTVHAQEIEEVVVTGSRIPRAGFDTLEPATVVSREYIDQRGLTNVADALNEIPGFGVGVTPEGGQASYGVGVNFVNRFGLGSNRTLTLVNGRRFVTSNPPTLFGPTAPGVQVDLNAIPTALVDRVENLAIGGAPTYGADAIAGVVNVITLRDYEGAEISTTFGRTEHGSGERRNAHGLFGTSFGDGGGNVVISLSYDRVDGVLSRHRDFLAEAYYNTANPSAEAMEALFPERTPANDGRYDANVPFNTGPEDGIPNGVLIRDRRIWTTPFGGLISPVGTAFRPGSQNLLPGGFGSDGDVVLAFDPDGNLVPYDSGTPFSPVDASGGDGLNLVEAGQVTSDIERKTFNVMLRSGMTESIDLFVEGTYYVAESRELTDQWMYNSPLFGGLSHLIQFPADHPMLTDQARATLTDLGAAEFNLSKASRDLVTNNASADTTISRAVIGLEGAFEAVGRQFQWESYVNYGRNDADYFSLELNQQHFVNALNVVLGEQGQPVCSATPIQGLAIPGGTEPAADPACVPLDMFGDGRPSAAARGYVTQPTVSNTVLEQRVFNVSLSSTIAELYSGAVEYAVGYEHRKEKGRFSPDPFLVEGLGRSTPITPLEGDYRSNELFAEVIVPLVDRGREQLLAKRLDIIGKYRSVDNSINDRADAYTYGLQWAPIDDFEIRGNFTRSIRAPAIAELFLPRATAFQSVEGDPCDSRFISGGPRPEVRQRNCEAFLDYYGLSSFSSNAHGATIQGIAGGNPRLDNEVADSLTYGFSWEPSFASRLRVSADYYKIEIDSVISSLSSAELASACFDSEDFDAANVPNANSFCSQITRTPPGSANPGQATTFVSGFVNGRYLDMEAYSAEIRYDLELTRAGQLSLALTGYFPKELTIDNTGTSPKPEVGKIGGVTDQQYQLFTQWQRGSFGANLSIDYLSDAVFDVLGAPESRDFLGVGDYTLLHAGATYRLNERMRLRLAIANLLDEDPPFPAFGAESVGMYDMLSRRYSLTFEWRQ